MAKCKKCQREFSSKKALKMHVEHKHMSEEQAKKHRSKNEFIGKIKNNGLFILIVLGVIAGIIWYFYFRT